MDSPGRLHGEMIIEAGGYGVATLSKLRFTVGPDQNCIALLQVRRFRGTAYLFDTGRDLTKRYP
jgi:hypothetical protein